MPQIQLSLTFTEGEEVTFFCEGTVDVHMTWLRQKIEENPSEPRHLVTVRGIGYRFDN